MLQCALEPPRTSSTRIDGATTSLAQWDGKSAAAIESVFERWRGETALPGLLSQLFDDGELAVAVTWLIKRALEDVTIAPGQVALVPFRNMDRLHEPYTQLQVLQEPSGILSLATPHPEYPRRRLPEVRRLQMF